MRPHDVEGAVARAWRVRQPPPREPAHAATLACWLVNGPFHPWWSWWCVSLIHLRDIPGVRPAWKKYGEAQFEFGIDSIDPETCPPDLEKLEQSGASSWRILSPRDVCEHFHGVRDDQAVRIAELAIRGICDGRLSPDQDYRAVWNAVIAQTVAHFRSGKHEVPS